MASADKKCAQCGVPMIVETIIDSAQSHFGLGSPVRKIYEEGKACEEVEATVAPEIAERGGTILVSFYRFDDSKPLPESGTIEVKVPHGVRTGTRLRLRGAGNAGCDLYVVLRSQVRKPELCTACRMQQVRRKPLIASIATSLVLLALLSGFALLRGCSL